MGGEREGSASSSAELRALNEDRDGPARAQVAALLRAHCPRGMRLGVYLGEPFGPRLLVEVDSGFHAGAQAVARVAIEQAREVFETHADAKDRFGVVETFAVPVARADRVLGAVAVSAPALRPEDRVVARSVASAVARVLGNSGRLNKC